VAIDTASAKNVGVFIWTDDTNATVNDIVYLADTFRFSRQPGSRSPAPW